jgi:hypothetical protein
MNEHVSEKLERVKRGGMHVPQTAERYEIDMEQALYDRQYNVYDQ